MFRSFCFMFAALLSLLSGNMCMHLLSFGFGVRFILIIEEVPTQYMLATH